MHAHARVASYTSKDLIPTLACSNNYSQHKLAKVGIKFCRFAIDCVSFVHIWINYPVGIVITRTDTNG